MNDEVHCNQCKRLIGRRSTRSTTITGVPAHKFSTQPLAELFSGGRGPFCSWKCHDAAHPQHAS